MTIFCEPDGGSAADLVAQLNTDEKAGLYQVADLPDVAVSMSCDPDERLLVIGSTIPFDDALCFADEVRTERPDVTVVLVREQVDETLLAEAEAAGIHEVLPAGDKAALEAACARIREHHAEQSAQHAELWRIAEEQVRAENGDVLEDGRHSAGVIAAEAVAEAARLPKPLGHMITVFSPKGGTGKTVVAANLAVLLHEAGSRVCLVDLSLEFGDVAISMRLAPTRTIIDATRLPDYTDVAGVVAAVATPFRDGLDCVLAPVNPGDAEQISPSVVADLLRSLRQNYDYVVLDTPSRFSEHVLEALDASDFHVLVTTPEIPSLKNLRLTLDTLDLLDYPREKRFVVLNRAEQRAAVTTEVAEGVLGGPLALELPASADIPASLNEGVPLAVSNGGHQLVVALRDFAKLTIGEIPETEDRREKRRGLIRRRSR